VRPALCLWLLVLGPAGCGEPVATVPSETAQQDCVRGGGVWRGTHCETSSGGGY
jgi:hypothetical protein